tara:strand:- start:1100 stop:1909 length:810 start_codon:yes stop_codon:yes gene_type:complete
MFYKDLNSVMEARKSSNIPIWQIVSDDYNVPRLQLNTNVPVGVRDNYYPQVAQADFDEIYDFILDYYNNSREVTVLEHHIELDAKSLPSDVRYYHDEVRVNKNIIDPLTFAVDLDIFESQLNGISPEEVVKSTIDNIISVLSEKNIKVSRKDFIILTSPFDTNKRKYSFHLILRRKNVLCRNQYSFLNLLREVKGGNQLLDKMFPGMITRIYKTGKYPMNQSKGRLFDCYDGIDGTMIKKDFIDDRDFFKNTLMYFHDYDLNREDYILI